MEINLEYHANTTVFIKKACALLKLQKGGFPPDMATSTERHAISLDFLFPEFRTDWLAVGEWNKQRLTNQTPTPPLLTCKHGHWCVCVNIVSRWSLVRAEGSELHKCWSECSSIVWLTSQSCLLLLQLKVTKQRCDFKLLMAFARVKSLEWHFVWVKMSVYV